MTAAKNGLARLTIAPRPKPHRQSHHRSFDLNRSLAALVAQFRNIIGESTTLEANTYNTIPLVHGDEEAIGRAITTLLCFSLHCLHEQPGTISLRTGMRFFANVKRKDLYIFIEVSDTGLVSVEQRGQALSDGETVMNNVHQAAEIHGGEIIIEPHHDITRTIFLISAGSAASGRIQSHPSQR